MPEALGWASSAVLLATLVEQLRKQWRARSARGVSRWLFVGQATASLGFTVYSALLGNWVFTVTNSLLLLSALLGIVLTLQLRHQPEERRQTPRSDATDRSVGRSDPTDRSVGRDDEPRSSVALLLIDVVNGFDFPDSEGLVQAAEGAAPRILALRERARAEDVPIIYVNDNFGRWRSDFRNTVSACAEPGQPGHRVTRMLEPAPSDYFVLKPRHSAFYGTALELLLDRLGARTLVLAGFATNICVLFTANDAHMRGYRVLVPSDCTASNTPARTEQALEQMRLVASAGTEESEALDFRALLKQMPSDRRRA